MLKIGKQILHWTVLVITGIALIGVNVTQSCCVHANQVHWTVKVLPTADVCPCEEECTCCCAGKWYCADGCHTEKRHAYYKITDSSIVERCVQMELKIDCLPEFNVTGRLVLPLWERQPDCETAVWKIPEIPLSPAWLCTFLC